MIFLAVKEIVCFKYAGMSPETIGKECKKKKTPQDKKHLTGHGDLVENAAIG
jgi:hypothetical protein